ncbi:glucose dehydrogenase [FAD, quinone]-like, partial [Centruroides sculpturatus]|uniref:glucose dehydrogenase [FAD, quinone]-like n=1 Tax=Centruroides sculpturatus TaxID=218467 RepID=UPI000C6E2DE1
MILILLMLIISVVVEGVHDDEYDFIIVGSGAGGSVMAKRLSEDPSNKVLLLEAGDRPSMINEILGKALSVLKGAKFNWNYTSVPNIKIGQALKERRLVATAGKLLGGSTMINAGVYSRGNRHDYDNWARNGAIGWDWKSVYPYFLKTEDNRDDGIINNGYHAVGGELVVQFPPFHTPLANGLIEAAEATGYPYGDFNAEPQTVFMQPQGYINRGIRWTAVRAFIDPIVGRRNFRLITSALVTKILIGDNNRAYGVLFEHKGKQMKAYARREVIVSAGTFNSPKLLMLSGIGPKENLHSLQIPVVSDIPVGQNLIDHASTLSMQFLADSYTFAEHRITKEYYDELLINGTGPLATIGGVGIEGFVNTKYSKQYDWPDLMIFWDISGIDNGLSNANDELQSIFDKFKDKDIIICAPYVIRTKSRGVLTLASNNPHDDPLIDFNIFSHPYDLKVEVE